MLNRTNAFVSAISATVERSLGRILLYVTKKVKLFNELEPPQGINAGISRREKGNLSPVGNHFGCTESILASKRHESY